MHTIKTVTVHYSEHRSNELDLPVELEAVAGCPFFPHINVFPHRSIATVEKKCADFIAIQFQIVSCYTLFYGILITFKGRVK